MEGFTDLRGNSRDRIKKELLERKRSLLYLIVAYLREHNLNSSAECVANEAQLSGDYEVCDNVDLDTILQEYQSYYFAKFTRQPKILKVTSTSRPIVKNAKTSISPKESVKKRTINCNPNEDLSLQVQVRGLSKDSITTIETIDQSIILKPLCDFDNYSSDLRDLAEMVINEVVPKNLGVKWNDCVGMSRSIELLKESLTYPLIYPHLFKDLTSPWKGILLYGPPGTGKTLLCRAAACETNAIFFNVSSGSFVTKWRGDSEKMLKILFDIARFNAPSTIFIDELDALTSSRDDQHDASRRFKSELLTQLDGILSHEDNRVFVLATTNRPWDLDTAILRRFEKRILVDLPNGDTRVDLFRYFVKNCLIDDWTHLITLTEGYSAADIKAVCRETCMRKVRKCLALVNSGKITVDEVNLDLALQDDVQEVLKNVRPSTNPKLIEKYSKWQELYGCF